MFRGGRGVNDIRFLRSHTLDGGGGFNVNTHPNLNTNVDTNLNTNLNNKLNVGFRRNLREPARCRTRTVRTVRMSHRRLRARGRHGLCRGTPGIKPAAGSTRFAWDGRVRRCSYKVFTLRRRNRLHEGRCEQGKAAPAAEAPEAGLRHPFAELRTPSPSPAATMHAWGLDSNGAKLSKQASRPSTEKLNDFSPFSSIESTYLSMSRTQSRNNSIVSAPLSAGSFGIVLSGRLDLRNELLSALNPTSDVWQERYFVLTRKALHHYSPSKNSGDLFGKHEARSRSRRGSGSRWTATTTTPPARR